MLRKWLDEEKLKLAGMSRGESAEYIWHYYKLWIIGVFCLLFMMIYIFYTATMTPKDNHLYVMFANIPVGSGTEYVTNLHDELAEYAGFDLKQKKLVLDTNCYCKPSEKPFSNRYYDKLVALLDGGILDAVVMEEEELLALANSGRLLDLQGERFTINDKWASRLVYFHNTELDYEKTEIPVAVDLTGSILTVDDGPYPSGCAIAVGAASAHPQELEMMLSFLFSEER